MNPLVEWPPLALDNNNNNNSSTATAARRRSAVDFLPLLDVWYARLDTYPIQYWAHLLGLRVPPKIPLPLSTNNSTTMQFESAPSLVLQQQSQQQQPDWTYFGQRWRELQQQQQQAVDEDTAGLSLVDPTFTQLLLLLREQQQQQGDNATTILTRPVTAVQWAKLSESSAVPLYEDLARECGCLPNDHDKVHPWQQYYRQQQQSSSSSSSCLQAPATPFQLGWVVTRHHTLQGRILYRLVEWYTHNTPTTQKPCLLLELDSLQVCGHEYLPQAPLPLTSYAALEQVFVHKSAAHHGNDSNNNNNNNNNSQLGLCVYLVALALEHARGQGVDYAVLKTTPGDDGQPLFRRYFGMTASSGGGSNRQQLVCDLHKTSTRHALWTFRQDQKRVKDPSAAVVELEDAERPVVPKTKQRWLVRLPNHQQVSSVLNPSASVVERSKRAVPEPSFVTGVTGATRNVTLRMRARLLGPQQVECRRRLLDIDNNSNMEEEEGPVLTTPDVPMPCLDVLKSFDLPKSSSSSDTNKNNDSDDEILQQLESKQSELAQLESSLRPGLNSLLTQIIHERVAYEKNLPRRQQERQILAQHSQMLQRRKERDLAAQRQLEQDMDAVCEICLDGEVTPDNQILFCEACNVAVHQVCYGIAQVPAGDYYCLPCHKLGRDRRMAAPLPIACELCPLKQGAFVQTDYRQADAPTFGKWVHVVCAKWQGLSFVDEQQQQQQTDLIEDVTELKVHFRQHEIVCYLCRGERGAMNQCHREGCPKWLHVTCARATGLCQVVHGEDCKGGVDSKDAWSLFCPEHSQVEESPKNEGGIPVEQLRRFAKEFPPEPKPPPMEVVPKPFNTVGGEERARLLRNDKYEQELLRELTTKKLYGFRCEVCDVCEEEGRNLRRCAGCMAICCVTCVLETEISEGTFKCAGCRHIEQKTKAGEKFEKPHCIACCQKDGLLRAAMAQPISKRSFWHHNQKELKKSLFGKPIFVHSLCTL